MNPEYLKVKHDLHKSPEVESAAKHNELKEGERVSQNPTARIQNYLDRLERLVLDPEKKQSRKILSGQSGAIRPRTLSLLREMVMNQYVRQNKEKMGESAVRFEERVAEDMGVEHVGYGPEQQEERGNIAVEDVESSLDQWIDYLSDPREPYPVWFRYYTFRNILELSEFDKDKGVFPKRSDGTIKLFPEVDRGALAYVQDMIDCSKNPSTFENFRTAQQVSGVPDQLLLSKEQVDAFARMSFAKQYAEGMKLQGEISPELREETRGQWRSYPQGSDPTPLWASLQNKGTAWCTKGFATASAQLQKGDFHVYYTFDKQGNPTIPRLAIRMQGSSIGEIRGVADNEQNVEEQLAEIADEKMKTLPGSEQYLSASRDTKLLKLIYKKSKTGEDLSKDELVFLYEIEKPISGFGFKRHPRIDQILESRNPQDDVYKVFDYPKDQIAFGYSQISDKTKVYIGPLVSGIFELLPATVESIHETFPGQKMQIESMTFESKKKEDLISALNSHQITLDGRAHSMIMDEPDENFGHSEEIKFIRLQVSDLGFREKTTLQEIVKRAEIIGLELCSMEMVLHYRLSLKEQQVKDWMICPLVKNPEFNSLNETTPGFYVARSGKGLELKGDFINDQSTWLPKSSLLFRIRKKVEKT